MNGAHQGQGELVPVEADQGQLEFLISQKLRQLEDHKFDAGMILKEGDKTLHADGLGFKQRDPQAGR
jgi:hypothetical protein